MNQLHQHIKSVEDCVNQALQQIGFRMKDNTPNSGVLFIIKLYCNNDRMP